MFLVIHYKNARRAKTIVYIRDTSHKTIKDAVEYYCDEYITPFLYEDYVYDEEIIKEHFCNTTNCITEDGEFDIDLFEEQLNAGEVDLSDIEPEAKIEIIKSNHIDIDDEGDII